MTEGMLNTLNFDEKKNAILRIQKVKHSEQEVSSEPNIQSKTLKCMSLTILAIYRARGGFAIITRGLRFIFSLPV